MAVAPRSSPFVPWPASGQWLTGNPRETSLVLTGEWRPWPPCIASHTGQRSTRRTPPRPRRATLPSFTSRTGLVVLTFRGGAVITSRDSHHSSGGVESLPLPNSYPCRVPLLVGQSGGDDLVSVPQASSHRWCQNGAAGHGEWRQAQDRCPRRAFALESSGERSLSGLRAAKVVAAAHRRDPCELSSALARPSAWARGARRLEPSGGAPVECPCHPAQSRGLVCG